MFLKTIFHFIDGKTQAQRGTVTYSRSQYLTLMNISQKHQGVCMYTNVYHSIFLPTGKIMFFEISRIGEFYNQNLKTLWGEIRLRILKL